MENRRVLNIAIGLVAFAALLVVILVVFNTGAPAPSVAARPTATAPATPNLAITSTPTVRPTWTTIAATSTPAIIPTTGTPAITATTLIPDEFPTITNGPEYPANFAQQGLFIQPVAGKPPVSWETALKAMIPKDDPFTIVSDHQYIENGQTILYTAYYGLVTDGFRGPDGRWAGNFLNIPLRDCAKGACNPTGEVLDHLENRPMWLFDLQITVALSHATCPPAGTPCAETIDPNHQVNLVDAQTLMFIGGVSYYRP